MRKKTSYFYHFSFGTNLGFRELNLKRAVALMRKRGIDVSKCSAVIETEPQGFDSPHKFLNMVGCALSDKTPREVLAITQHVERKMGRKRKSSDGHYEDRIIDIDVLMAGHEVIYTPELRLPHPRMWQRDFVMRPFRELSPATLKDYPCVATIGYFDGQHLGHQHLMAQVKAIANAQGKRPMLITFDRHPRSVVGPMPTPVPALSTETEKRIWFVRNRSDHAVLEFGPEMAALTAREFMERILRDQLNVQTLIIGHDNRFGRPTGRPESFADYQRYGTELGIDVRLATEYDGPEGHVSSSTIRRALTAGDIPVANAMLGRTYKWHGTVVHGKALGRRIGFPTANLVDDGHGLMLPGNGAYAAWAYIPGEPQLNLYGTNPPGKDDKPLPPSGDKDIDSTISIFMRGGVEGPHNGFFRAMVNIGTRPTIDDGSQVTVEAHLLDCDSDLYSKGMTLYFVQRLRGEQQFADTTALAEALHADRERLPEILIEPPR